MSDRDQKLFELMFKHHKLFLQLDAEDIQDYLIGVAKIEGSGVAKRLTWRVEEGYLHRDGDRPAMIWVSGTREWYRNGQHHRGNDQPAIIYADGEKQWRQHGALHRDGDQPAVIYAEGTREWWVNGARHRDNGRPAVVNTYGSNEWWVKGGIIRCR